MDKLTLEYEIGILKQIIERQKLRISSIHENNKGVRSGAVSADIAHHQMILQSRQEELQTLEEQLEEINDLDEQLKEMKDGQ